MIFEYIFSKNKHAFDSNLGGFRCFRDHLPCQQYAAVHGNPRTQTNLGLCNGIVPIPKISPPKILDILCRTDDDYIPKIYQKIQKISRKIQNMMIHRPAVQNMMKHRGNRDQREAKLRESEQRGPEVLSWREICRVPLTMGQSCAFFGERLYIYGQAASIFFFRWEKVVFSACERWETRSWRINSMLFPWHGGTGP